jgi:hypothetical protein
MTKAGLEVQLPGRDRRQPGVVGGDVAEARTVSLGNRPTPDAWDSFMMGLRMSKDVDPSLLAGTDGPPGDSM